MLWKRGGNHQQTESGAIGQMGDLFEDYAAGPAWDEMFDPNGGLRPRHTALHGAPAPLRGDDPARRGAPPDRSLRAHGPHFPAPRPGRPTPHPHLAPGLAADR